MTHSRPPFSRRLASAASALGLVVSTLSMIAAPSSHLSQTATPPLPWTPLTDLPDPVGLKGLYGGPSQDRLLVAGGSNFPRSAREGGVKTYHDTIFSRAMDAADDAPWTAESLRLPEPLAEGGNVVTPAGIILVGGRNASGLSAAVRLMDWDAEQGGIRLVNLPDLPTPRASCAVAWSEGWIYVAGGEGVAETAADFLRLNLQRWQQTPDEVMWEPLPDCPGPRRFGATLMPVRLDGETRLILAGGRRITSAPVAESDYRRDAWSYDPSHQEWQRRADLPRPMLLGNAVSTGEASFAIGGGSDGHDLARMVELGERYRLPDDIVHYDAASDRWSTVGKMPIGVAAAASLRVGDHWIVAGGEYSPGLRTASVFRLPLEALRQTPRS